MSSWSDVDLRARSHEGSAEDLSGRTNSGLAHMDVLDGFERRLVGSSRSALLRALAVTAEAPGRGVEAPDGALRGAGWRWLGALTVRVTMMPGVARDTWVDPRGTTCALVPCGRASEAVSTHVLWTFLEDGSCVETAGRSRRQRLDARLVQLPSAGEISADARAHLLRVAESDLCGARRPIALRDIDDVIRLTIHYHRHVLSDGAVAALNRRWKLELVAMFLSGAAFLAAVSAIFGLLERR